MSGQPRARPPRANQIRTTDPRRLPQKKRRLIQTNQPNPSPPNGPRSGLDCAAKRTARSLNRQRAESQSNRCEGGVISAYVRMERCGALASVFDGLWVSRTPVDSANPISAQWSKRYQSSTRRSAMLDLKSGVIQQVNVAVPIYVRKDRASASVGRRLIGSPVTENQIG